MVLKLAITEANQLPLGNAEYLSDGYSLEYKVDCYPVSYRYLLMCDTLTIEFDEISKDFLSFDAYAPQQCWKRTDLIEIPKDYKIGTLIVIEGFEDDKREYYDFDPTFEYSNKGILKINFCDNSSGSTFFQIAEDLIAGIKDHQLTCFYLLKISFS